MSLNLLVPSSRPGRRRSARPCLEPLEPRRVLAAALAAPPVAEIEVIDTLTHAQPLDDPTAGISVLGTLGNSPAGKADVDWYSFTLNAPTQVSLRLAGSAAPVNGVLSLYNSDPFDFADPYDPLGYRLLGQADGAATGGVAALDRPLAAG